MGPMIEKTSSTWPNYSALAPVVSSNSYNLCYKNRREQKSIKESQFYLPYHLQLCILDPLLLLGLPSLLMLSNYGIYMCNSMTRGFSIIQLVLIFIIRPNVPPRMALLLTRPTTLLYVQDGNLKDHPRNGDSGPMQYEKEEFGGRGEEVNCKGWLRSGLR